MILLEINTPPKVAFNLQGSLIPLLLVSLSAQPTEACLLQAAATESSN